MDFETNEDKLPVFPALPGEQEFLDLVVRLRPLGFGRMMQIISFAWHEVDPIGAFASGECYGMLSPEDLERTESVKRSDPLDYAAALNAEELRHKHGS